MTNNRAFYLTIPAVIQIVVALVPSASKIVIDSMPVELYIALRWTISGLIFLALASFFEPPRLTIRDVVRLIGLGIVGYAFSSLGTLYALKLGGVVNFAILTSVTPVITASVLILILEESVSRTFSLACVLCVAGTVMVAAGKFDLSGWRVAGGSAVLVVGAYAFQALPFAFSKKLHLQIPLPHYLATLQLSAAAFMWSLEATWLHQSNTLASTPAVAWGAVVFVAVISCCISFGVTYWLLRHIEGHKLALFEGLHPVFAALYGVLFFAEPFNATMVAGGALLMSSLVIANLSKRESAE